MLGTLNSLGELYESMGRYSEAEPAFTKALEIGRASLGSEDPLVADSLRGLAGLSQTLGKFQDAEARYRRCSKPAEKRSGRSLP